MNILREDLGDQTALLKVVISSDDYNEPVEKALRTYKRKATIPGFRPGMVPMGVINKMYRKSTIAEETYRLSVDACLKYIEDNKIDIIGDIMPSEKQQQLDFENGTEFEFQFEIGLAPEINISLSDKDKVKKYEIEITDEMREGYRSNFLRRYGSLVDVDVVTKEEALNVTLDQEDMKIEDAYVGLIGMTDEERAPFIGKKVGDVMSVNVNELYKDPKQRAAILSMKEEELAEVNPEFTLTITGIRTFADPEINEEFFKLAFPDGNVTDEKQLAEYIDSKIAEDLKRESDYRFDIDMRQFILSKADFSLPENFLKNWLYAANQGKFSMEEIEKEFPQFIEMMKLDSVKRHYAISEKLQITEDDAKAEAKAMASAQFAYYGMHSVADDMMENYVNSILGNKEEAKKIYDKLAERKVFDFVASKIKVENTKITAEEFSKLFQ